MSIRLLGPVSVLGTDSRELLPAGPRVRGLLARLALDAGHPVDASTLVDALWGADPPSTANALQSLVSRLRKALGTERLRGAAGGYCLEVDPDDVDALRFAALRRAAASEPGHGRASDLLTQALALWHHPVLGGVRDLPFAAPAAARLTESRADAAEELAARGLAGGAPEAGREILAAILDDDPLRETTAIALARGLHAGGRRADALAVLDRTRTALADALGVDPGPDLLRARTELLRDGPAPRAGRARPQPQPQPQPQPTLAPGRGALTSFVGREDDLERLRSLTGTARLVTVTGPGGAGKTRLAHETVHDLGRRVAVAELAGLSGSDQLPPTILHAVGGPDLALGDHGSHDGVPDTIARVRLALGDRDLVLLLDNCEHLVDAVASLVHELLTTVPGLIVLATSREPLGVPGEVLHPVGALDAPDASRLFAERAATVRPGFVLDDHRSAVTEICRRLDGQPLPIELAAARVRSLEPAEIAERLADRFRLLVAGPRTAMPRHQTLRAVIDWSWDLLSGSERAVAARFGVFAGAVDADAVDAVCGPDGFDTVRALVEKSLVVSDPDPGAGPTRYRMLETIREYAAVRLEASGERAAIVDAHADHVLAVLEPGEPRLRTQAQLDQLAIVHRVEGEAVRALERETAGGRPDRAHRLLAAMSWSWVIRGDMATLTVWSERVAALPDPGPGPAAAVNRTLRAVLRASYTEPGVRAETEAVDAMAPALPCPWHPVVALHGPTVRAFTQDDRSELLALADGVDGVDDIDRVGEPWLRAAAAYVVVVHAENAGEPDVQRRYLRAAHEGFSEVGDRFGLGMTTFSLGELEDLAGDRTAAREAYVEAIALSEQLRNVDDLPQYRMALALVAARDGDPWEAHAQLEIAEGIAHESSAPWAAAWLAWGRADVERRLGRPTPALELLATASPAFIDGPGPGRGQREAMVHTVAAAALIDLGRHAEARDRLETAARAALGSDDGPVLGQVAEVAARWAITSDDPERAGELLGLAIARRGNLHLGDPDVVATRDAVIARLGPAAADAALDRGRATPRDTPPRP